MAAMPHLVACDQILKRRYIYIGRGYIDGRNMKHILYVVDKSGAALRKDIARPVASPAVGDRMCARLHVVTDRG